MSENPYSALAGSTGAALGVANAAGRVLKRAEKVAPVVAVVEAAAPLLGAAVGIGVWPVHPVLGALNGAAAAQNVVGLARGLRGLRQGVRSGVVQVGATAGALALPLPAPLGYLAGGAVGKALARRLLPGPEVPPYAALAGSARRTIFGDFWSDVSKANPLDWGDVADAGRVVAPVAGTIANVYAPGLGTAGANLAEQGIDSAQGRSKQTVTVSPSQPKTKATTDVGKPAIGDKADLARVKKEAAASQAALEKASAPEKWKYLAYGATGVAGVGLVGAIIYKLVTR